MLVHVIYHMLTYLNNCIKLRKYKTNMTEETEQAKTIFIIIDCCFVLQLLYMYKGKCVPNTSVDCNN